MKFDRLPVLILSTPRTGSTPLLHYIQKQHGPDVQLFMEPTTGNWQPNSEDWQTGDEMVRFNATISSTDKFIVKDHIHTFHKHSKQSLDILLSDRTLKIRLQRRNFAEQIASRYIVWCRKEWHYTEIAASKTSVAEVPVYTNVIIDIATKLKKINKQLSESTITFDVDLFYEDIITLCDLKQTGFIETPKPDNYPGLIKHIEYQIKNIPHLQNE